MTPRIDCFIPYVDERQAKALSRMFDDEPEGDPIGVVPVGEPLVLLVMALLYVVYIRIHKQRA